jgi:glycosyltransferase involved in cell wall biosynthesis
MEESPAAAPYRFGFALTTVAGNMTRYLNLRKYAERDPEVVCVWAPISHYLESDRHAWLPGPIRTRAIVMQQARPVMSQLRRLDAVMFHAFEPFVWAVLRRLVCSRPLLVWSQDNPPLSDLQAQSLYEAFARNPWRRRLRFRFDVWCARRVALFLPFSHWAARALIQDCGITGEKVHPIHVGLDLDLWPYLPKEDAPEIDNRQSKSKSTQSASIENRKSIIENPNRPQILFVGSEFVRKGGDLLLEVYRRHFAEVADLHLVTGQPPEDLPAHAQVHTGLRPNDPRLRELYARSDLFALPTRADMSSWVAMEAMATGRPVITTDVGGIPDIVQEGKTGFLIPPNDGAALADRLRTLLADAALRRRMGAAGRAWVEQEFNAAVCVPRILEQMKRAVDASRALQAGKIVANRF